MVDGVSGDSDITGSESCSNREDESDDDDGQAVQTTQQLYHRRPVHVTTYTKYVHSIRITYIHLAFLLCIYTMLKVAGKKVQS